MEEEPEPRRNGEDGNIYVGKIEGGVKSAVLNGIFVINQSVNATKVAF